MKIRLFKPKKFSTHRLTFAWKAIPFITAGHDLRTKIQQPDTAWKAERLQLHKRISTPTKKNTDRLDDLSIYWWIPIIWGLRVFAPSWQIKVLPFRQVSDDDSYRRINSAVMKIRLFKPKKFSIHRLPFAWKATTFITAGHRPTEKIQQTYAAWKAELLQLHKWISTLAKRTNKTKIPNLKFPFLTS